MDGVASAFVLGRKERGERDLFLELLLEEGFVVPAVAPSALGSSRRFAGGLGAFQKYRVRFDTRRRRAGATRYLAEATVERAWLGVLSALHRTTAAGLAASLLREAGTIGEADPWPYTEYESLLNSVDAATPSRSGAVLLRFALAWCEHAGHPVVLDSCVRCGREAPAHSSVRLEPAEGGVLCSQCGQGSLLLRALDRAALLGVMAGEDEPFKPGMLPWLARVLGVYAPHTARSLAAARW